MTKAAYLGCFAHQLDQHGRVMLPAQWRGGETFTLQLVETPAPHIVASVTVGAAGLDPAGWIAIPEELSRAAGIEQEAVLVGLLESFELWSPSVYLAQAARSGKEEIFRSL
jgi:DNA-binding transcriptional regulator/RsmH inhibitor MraZ